MALKPKKAVGGAGQGLGAGILAVNLAPVFANWLPDIPEKVWIIILTGLFAGLARISLNFLKHKGYDWLISSITVLAGCSLVSVSCAGAMPHVRDIHRATMEYRVDNVKLGILNIETEGISLGNIEYGSLDLGRKRISGAAVGVPVDENDGATIIYSDIVGAGGQNLEASIKMKLTVTVNQAGKSN